MTIPQFHLVNNRDQYVKSINPVRVKLEPVQHHDKEKTVLVVEDNPDLLVVISDIVGKAYNVITAFNGKEGLATDKSTFPGHSRQRHSDARHGRNADVY